MEFRVEALVGVLVVQSRPESVLVGVLVVQSRPESVLVGVLVCGSRVVVRLVNSQTGERLELSVAVFTWKQGPLQQQIIQSSENSFNELAEFDKSPRHITHLQKTIQ